MAAGAEAARGFSVSWGRKGAWRGGAVVSRWAGPLGDGEAAVAVPSAVLGCRAYRRLRVSVTSVTDLHSEPGSLPREVGSPGAPGSPGASSRLSECRLGSS